MIRYTADWILPIVGAPMRRGVVEIDAGRVVTVSAHAVGDVIDLGSVAVMPALVNAHTHLELSYLRGRIGRRERFLEWIDELMSVRREFPDAADQRILDAARIAIDEARASGTGLVGDISNTLVTIDLVEQAGLDAHVFFEILGFNAPDAVGRVSAARAQLDAVTSGRRHVRASLAAHAPYSVSPALFSAIRADLDRHEGTVSSVHLGESPEELEFLERGTGPWRAMLERLGVWSDTWTPPRASPVAYLSELGFLDRSVLAVHGVQFDGADLSRLSALDMTIVSCPRSNQYVGVGTPPLEAFYAMDVDVAFGTDSLASCRDLNVFAEIAEARRLAPRVPARKLLESATAVGARALRYDETLGTIEPGKQATLIAVRVPQGVTDVEEYLVSGITPDAVRWMSHE